MYKNEIMRLLNQVDPELNIENSEMEVDLRVLGMDSIIFIQFLALIEEYFDIEFEYGFMDDQDVISIEVLNELVMEKSA